MSNNKFSKEELSKRNNNVNGIPEGHHRTDQDWMDETLNYINYICPFLGRHKSAGLY